MAIDASGYQFQFYSQGIYSSSQCDSTHLNHAMLIIGYGSYYDDKYWIMKNRYYRTMSARETRVAVYTDVCNKGGHSMPLCGSETVHSI